MSFRHIQFQVKSTNPPSIVSYLIQPHPSDPIQQVRGRVQGVSYRKWAATRGDELSLKGWVRNSDDGGAVEGEAVGEGGAVSSL
jgi:hypothetical protein